MKQDNYSFEYRLEDIDIVKFNYNKLNLEKINSKDISSEFMVGYHFDTQHEIVILQIKSLFNHASSNNENVCELIVNYKFQVKGLTEAESNNDKIRIPDDFILLLISISYSTTRGIFFEKCATTDLKNFIFPIINPKDFLPPK